jgi:hypothetical protein
MRIGRGNRSTRKIQNVPRGKVSILGDHSFGHSKQNKCICTCVLFRTVSEIQLFHCPVPKSLIRKEILQIVSNTGVYYSSDKSWYTLRTITHFRKFHRQQQNTLQLVHISIFGTFHNTPTVPLSTVTTANWRFRQWRCLVGGKHNIGRQIQTNVQCIQLNRAGIA